MNEVWKWGAMFIILLYLCNLRSHLIKGIMMKSPESIEELATTRYSFKVLIFFAFNEYQPEMIPIKNQNRQVVESGMINICPLLSLYIKKIQTLLTCSLNFSRYCKWPKSKRICQKWWMCLIPSPVSCRPGMEKSNARQSSVLSQVSLLNENHRWVEYVNNKSIPASFPS